MNEPTTAAIEAAIEPIAKEFWARHSDVPCWILPHQVEQFTKLSAYILRFGAQRGYEAAKAAESTDTTRDALVKALRHYADEENWNCSNYYCVEPSECTHEPCLYVAVEVNGYDIAREALKAIDAEEGKDAYP